MPKFQFDLDCLITLTVSSPTEGQARGQVKQLIDTQSIRVAITPPDPLIALNAFSCAIKPHPDLPSRRLPNKP